MAKAAKSWMQQPSVWVVLVSGTLVVSFCVGIIRELINSHQVRLQVKRLQTQVAGEEQRQHQLEDLIDYLGSPTFQEQEARLKLGLKKTGEQVIVVPASPQPVNGERADTNGVTSVASGSDSHAQRWWQYFFGAKVTHSTTS